MIEAPTTPIEHRDDAISRAIQFAERNDVCDARAAAAADVWFDAVKDFDRSDGPALDRYLAARFGIGEAVEIQP